MQPEDDIFKIVSDFMKGKTGPRDMEMAVLSFEGNPPPEELRPPQMSSSFADLIKEYPLVASGLSGCSLEHCLALFGSMLTLAEFQSNTYRLEVLVYLAFLCAKGKQRPTPAQLVAWFNQLDEGTCGGKEDPAEDVFLSTVTAKSGAYRLFEGTAEGNSFYTQIFLNVLDDMPDKPYQSLKAFVASLLRLSDEIAERAGLPVYAVGNTIPVSEIRKPSGQVWSDLRQRVSFTFEQLEQLEIDTRSLPPFVIQSSRLGNLREFSPAHNPVDFEPIFPTQRGLIVFMPTLIGTAIRSLIIESCLDAGVGRVLHEALATAFASHFTNEAFLGSSAPPFDMKGQDSFYASQVVKEIDKGRYLHLLFFVDGFDDFEKGGFGGINPVEKISDFVGKSIFHAHQTYSAKDGFREGLTIVIGCGWGRGIGLRLGGKLRGWRTEMIPAHDATTLSRTPSFKILDVFKALDAVAALERMNIELRNANGFLNMFGCVGFHAELSRFFHREVSHL